MAKLNQGLLEANFNIKNNIDLTNAFSSDYTTTPLLKTINGNISAKDTDSLKNLASGNSALQHISTIKSGASNTSLEGTLDNLPNIKYVRLEGNYTSDGKKFENSGMQKLDLTESIVVKPEDLKGNTNLRTLPKLNYSNPDLTDIITNDTNLLPTDLDLSEQNNTNKLGVHGDSTHQLEGLKTVKVSTEAPFDNQITPQIDVSYTGLNQNALVNLFNTMPYNVGYEVVGSPTIENGIASGFSTNDYLLTDSVFDNAKALSNCTIQTKITLPQSLTGYEQVLSVGFSTAIRDGFAISREGRILWYIFGSSNVLGGSASPLTLGQTYVIKGVIENGVATLYCGENEATLQKYDTKTITSGTLENQRAVRIGIGRATTEAFTGSIDLNETYIKINSHVSTGPVNYSVVGTPTIVDGVVSGFSGYPNPNQYIYVLGADLSSDFIIRIKIKTADNVSGAILGRMGNGSSGMYLQIVNTNSCLVRLYDRSGAQHYSMQTATQAAIETHTDYVCEISYNGQFYRWEITDTAGNVVFTHTYESANITGSSGGLAFGVTVSDLAYVAFGGFIDLNNTYIKVNGKLWFGHESKQVTWFNGKPAQIKVADISGATGTSSLTNDDKAIATNKGWSLVTGGTES